MKRGGIKIPGDTIRQLTIYSYIIFHEVLVNFFCRSSFCNILMLVSEMYNFDINPYHGMMISDIMFKN